MAIPYTAKRVFTLALPTIGENYLQNLLGIIDAFFIAKLGLLSINAVGVTNIYNMTFISVFTAVATVLSVFLSRAFGAKDRSRSRQVIFHGYTMTIFLGIVFSIISLSFSKSLLHSVGAHGDLEQTARSYFNIVLGLSPIVALYNAQSASFRAIGDTKIPLYVGIEMNLVHIVLDYLFIFGIGSYHGWGLTGAGIAMIIARLYGVCRLWFKSKQREAITLTVHDYKVSVTLLLTMLKFTIPTTLERLSMRLGQVIYFGLIVRMGTEVYATHNIAGTLTIFASTIGGGFAAATTACIGQSIGAGKIEDIKSYRFWGYIQSASLMTLITALLSITSPWIGLAFTDNVSVLHLLWVVLAIDTLSQPFLAAVVIDTATIQSGGNSTFPMIVTMAGIWGVRTLGVYIFAWHLDWGLPAVWACIAADNAFRASLYLWYRNKQKLIKVLA